MSENFIKASDLMPKEKHDLALLRSRAEKLAQNLAILQKIEKTHYCLQFKLQNQDFYGISQNFLDEVIYPQYLVNLAWLPDFISGVISWKGMILTVLDGNYICNRQASLITELSRIIVLNYQQQHIGLLVNELCYFVIYKPSQIKTSLQSPLSFNSDYFLGLLDYSLILINVEAIFNDPALKIIHQQ